MIMPGDNAKLNVELINPIAMDEGLRFAIREGGRTVGAGHRAYPQRGDRQRPDRPGAANLRQCGGGAGKRSLAARPAARAQVAGGPQGRQ